MTNKKKKELFLRRVSLPKDGNIADIVALIHIIDKNIISGDVHEDIHIAQGHWHGDGYETTFRDRYKTKTIDMPCSGLYTAQTHNKLIMVSVEEFYPIEVTWATHATVQIVTETAYMDDNYLEE